MGWIIAHTINILKECGGIGDTFIEIGSTLNMYEIKKDKAALIAKIRDSLDKFQLELNESETMKMFSEVISTNDGEGIF